MATDEAKDQDPTRMAREADEEDETEGHLVKPSQQGSTEPKSPDDDNKPDPAELGKNV